MGGAERILLFFKQKKKKKSNPKKVIVQKWVRVMKKRIRERVTKAKGAGLPRMIRVGNL